MLIEGRFNGPDGSGNGGHTAGLMAQALAPPAGTAVQVTLRRPPPLDTELRTVRTDDPLRLAVYAGQRLIADAEPVPLDRLGEPVPPVSRAEAAAVADTYPGFVAHPFPRCYVCGPERAEGDGLRIFPGLLPSGGTAALWRVPPEATPATVWAALDCPGGWSVLAGADRPYLLGRITAHVAGVPAPGSECVITGDVVATAGRKAEVRSALYRADSPGAPLAYALATWIAI